VLQRRKTFEIMAQLRKTTPAASAASAARAIFAERSAPLRAVFGYGKTLRHGTDIEKT
jgi:hypothetical protein